MNYKNEIWFINYRNGYIIARFAEKRIPETDKDAMVKLRKK